MNSIFNPFTGKLDLVRKQLYRSAIKEATQTITVDTHVLIEGLSIPLKANTRYYFEINLMTYCNNAGGMAFKLLYPAGSTPRFGFVGTYLSTQGYLFGMWEDSTVETTTYNRYIGVGYMKFSGVIQTGVTAGELTFNFRSGVAGQSSTVYSYSSVAAVIS